MLKVFQKRLAAYFAPMIPLLGLALIEIAAPILAHADSCSPVVLLPEFRTIYRDHAGTSEIFAMVNTPRPTLSGLIYLPCPSTALSNVIIRSVAPTSEILASVTPTLENAAARVYRWSAPLSLVSGENRLSISAAATPLANPAPETAITLNYGDSTHGQATRPSAGGAFSNLFPNLRPALAPAAYESGFLPSPEYPVPPLSDPVLHFTFDRFYSASVMGGDVGRMAVDFSPALNFGFVSPAGVSIVTPPNPKFGGALKFDGNPDGQITVASSESLRFDGGSNFAISFWVDGDASGSVLKQNGFEVAILNHKVEIRWNNQIFTAPVSLLPSVWNHVSVNCEDRWMLGLPKFSILPSFKGLKSSKTVSVELNGQSGENMKFSTTSALTGAAEGTTTLIGSGFRGLIDELEVFHRPLKAGEIGLLANARALDLNEGKLPVAGSPASLSFSAELPTPAPVSPPTTFDSFNPCFPNSYWNSPLRDGFKQGLWIVPGGSYVNSVTVCPAQGTIVEGYGAEFTMRGLAIRVANKNVILRGLKITGQSCMDGGTSSAIPSCRTSQGPAQANSDGVGIVGEAANVQIEDMELSHFETIFFHPITLTQCSPAARGPAYFADPVFHTQDNPESCVPGAAGYGLLIVQSSFAYNSGKAASNIDIDRVYMHHSEQSGLVLTRADKLTVENSVANQHYYLSGFDWEMPPGDLSAGTAMINGRWDFRNNVINENLYGLETNTCLFTWALGFQAADPVGGCKAPTLAHPGGEFAAPNQGNVYTGKFASDELTACYNGVYQAQLYGGLTLQGLDGANNLPDNTYNYPNFANSSSTPHFTYTPSLRKCNY
jgi:hypothetical protein